MLKFLYAVCLVLPRILFTPWREFELAMPETGMPFIIKAQQRTNNEKCSVISTSNNANLSKKQNVDLSSKLIAFKLTNPEVLETQRLVILQALEKEQKYIEFECENIEKKKAEIERKLYENFSELQAMQFDFKRFAQEITEHLKASVAGKINNGGIQDE